MDSHISPTMTFMHLNFAIEMFIIILKRSRALIADHLASAGRKLEKLKMKIKGFHNRTYGNLKKFFEI